MRLQHQTFLQSRHVWDQRPQCLSLMGSGRGGNCSGTSGERRRAVAPSLSSTVQGTSTMGSLDFTAALGKQEARATVPILQMRKSEAHGD